MFCSVVIVTFGLVYCYIISGIIPFDGKVTGCADYCLLNQFDVSKLLLITLFFYKLVFLLMKWWRNWGHWGCDFEKDAEIIITLEEIYTEVLTGAGVTRILVIIMGKRQIKFMRHINRRIGIEKCMGIYQWKNQNREIDGAHQQELENRNL